MSPGDVTDHSRPGWRSRDILKAAAIVLGLWIALHFLWIVRNVFIICFIGTILGIVISAATDRLERLRIPRAVGATAMLLLGLGALVGLGFATGPTISRQFGELRTRLPEVLERAEKNLGIAPAEIGREILAQQRQDAEKSAAPEPRADAKAPAERRETEATPAQGESSLRRVLASNFGAFREILFPVATATASFLGAFVIILFVALFIAISPRFYRDGLLRLLPVERRDYAREILGDVSSTLKQWALARFFAMIAVGLVVGVSLGVIGVRSAVLLGVIAGLFELIPFLGPIAAAIPAIGMALLDSPRQAILVAILFLVVQQLEGNLLSPLLLQNRVDVPPLLTIVTVTALTVVLGVLGALIAEPLVATILLLVRRLWVEDHLEASS